MKVLYLVATTKRTNRENLTGKTNGSKAILNTPTAHSSRRDRSVVSETTPSNSNSAVTHEQPVTNRTKIPSKHTRSGARRR